MRESPDTRPSLLIRLRDPKDERAWGEFVDIYNPLIHRIARQAGLQGADADDLAIFDEEYRRGLFRWAVDRVRGEFQDSTWQAFWQTAVEGRKPKEVAA